MRCTASVTRSARRLVLALLLGLTGGIASADRLLIDDFSIPQQGFVTDQLAAYDLLEDARLFGGGREIWGGGASVAGNCDPATMSASVSGGSLSIDVSQSCDGSGIVTWPARNSAADLDLSGYSKIVVWVEEIIGESWTRITFDSKATGFSSFDVELDHLGEHIFAIPEEVDMSSISSVTVASLITGREHLELGAVWLAVPEPSAIAICFAGVVTVCHWLRPVASGI